MKETSSRRIQNADNVEYTNIEALIDAENNMPGYNKSIVNKFAKHFGIESTNTPDEIRILEFGAGSGSLLDLFRDTLAISPECVEIDPSLGKILREKGYVTHEKIPITQNKFDYIYTSNVLEHIVDDVDALIQLRKTLKPGGRLAIYVPALPFLYSNLDANSGHFRRYKKSELVNKVEAAGFLVEKCFFSDSLGVPASLALKIFGYGNKFNLGFGNSLIIYDRVIYPVSKLIDSIGFKNLLGKNLFLYASVPSNIGSRPNKASMDLDLGAAHQIQKSHPTKRKRTRYGPRQDKRALS
jgi:SAM-dependent methyltransferase